MKLKVTRLGFEIIPESIQDEVFIEEVLGLCTEKDCAIAKRVNVCDVSRMAYVRINHKDDASL